MSEPFLLAGDGVGSSFAPLIYPLFARNIPPRRFQAFVTVPGAPAEFPLVAISLRGGLFGPAGRLCALLPLVVSLQLGPVRKSGGDDPGSGGRVKHSGLQFPRLGLGRLIVHNRAEYNYAPLDA